MQLVRKNRQGAWGEGGAAPGKSCKFYPHLGFKTVFPAFKLPENCYTDTCIFFLETHMLYMKDYPDNLTNKESKGFSKIPIFLLSYNNLKKIESIA